MGKIKRKENSEEHRISRRRSSRERRSRDSSERHQGRRTDSRSRSRHSRSRSRRSRSRTQHSRRRRSSSTSRDSYYSSDRGRRRERRRVDRESQRDSRRRPDHSSDSSESERCYTPPREPTPPAAPTGAVDIPKAPTHVNASQEVIIVNDSNPSVPSEPTAPSKPTDPIVVELDDIALEVLGEDPSKPQPAKNSVREEVIVRWSNWIVNGLGDKLADNFFEKYESVPELKAQQLNDEFLCFLSDKHNRRDSYFVNTQNIAAAALSAIGLADAQSRVKNIDTEWELASYAFKRVVHIFGTPNIDLFASRVNWKCKRYCSWYRDPDAKFIDAFTISWANVYFYAFPPFAIIAKVLRKIILDKACGVVIVPYWTSQTWFPIFKKLLIGDPLFLKPNINLLLSPCRTKAHPLAHQLTLLAGRLSDSRI
uniref:Uncharacterized protein n=1 Tax=Trichogramma kaykai TaxID=54128 RepID=A0ABD2WYL6_9HYME